MSAFVRDAARLAAGAKLNSTTRLVFVMLAAHANTAKLAWCGVPALAELVGVNEDNVRRALRQLEAEGLIEPVGGRSRGGRGRTTTYRLAIGGKPLESVHNPRGGDGVSDFHNPRGADGNPRGADGKPPRLRGGKYQEDPMKNAGARFSPGSGWIVAQ